MDGTTSQDLLNSGQQTATQKAQTAACVSTGALIRGATATVTATVRSESFKTIFT